MLTHWRQNGNTGILNSQAYQKYSRFRALDIVVLADDPRTL